jgi:hypothetical protein
MIKVDRMDISLEALQQALEIRRQIDALHRRLNSVLQLSHAARRRPGSRRKASAKRRVGGGRISPGAAKQRAKTKAKLPTRNPGTHYK